MTEVAVVVIAWKEAWGNFLGVMVIMFYILIYVFGVWCIKVAKVIELHVFIVHGIVYYNDRKL